MREILLFLVEAAGKRGKKQWIIVFHDAPEGNKELKEGLISDAQRLYLRAVGEPSGSSPAKTRKRTALEDNPLLLVEAAGLEPTVSSTRSDFYMLFAHNYLHIVRIFR